MAWRAIVFFAAATAASLAGCCAQPPPLDVAHIQAELAKPSRGDDPQPKAEHRPGGGVEVLLFSVGVNNRDFRSSSDAENARLLGALAPGFPNACKGATGAMIARVWGVADGAFTKPGASEKLAFVRIERCEIPRAGVSNTSWILGLFDATERVLVRVPLPEETTLERAPDPFGEGHYVVLVTTTGTADAKRATARLARFEGDALATVAESAPMDARCNTRWNAASFVGVLRPGRPAEFRTSNPDAKCERR